MGGESVANGEDILNQAGIPSFNYPDTAVHAFNYMWRYAYNLRGLYETPSPNAAAFHPDRARAAEILSAVRNSGRTILTEYESKKLLEAYGIPSVPTEIAETEDAAVAAAAAHRIPGGAQTALLHHHPQDRRRRSRSSTFPMPRACAEPSGKSATTWKPRPARATSRE